MANPTARAGRSEPEELPKSLTDRVMARVDDARIAVDRREGASRPKSKRRKRTPVESSAAEPSAQDLREAGVDLFVAGSSVFGADDPVAAYRALVEEVS